MNSAPSGVSGQGWPARLGATAPMPREIAARQGCRAATDWGPLNNLSAPERGAEIAARAKVEGVARDFEALWLDRVMASQRATVSRNELFDGGRGEEIFQAQLDGEFARLASRQGTTISGVIRESLIRSMNGYATRAAYGGAK